RDGVCRGGRKPQHAVAARAAKARPALARERPIKRAAPVLRPRPPDGRGGAGYPPQPHLVLRLHVVGALAVIGEVEAFALALNGRTQTDGEVDDLVDDQRTDAGPEQSDAHGPALGDELG